MTEDSSQLSVAELLARNGQQSGTPASGGGRRRRSGRGISVAELTGDIPVVNAGSSSHAAPDEDGAESVPEPASIESDYSQFSNFSNYSEYSNFSDFPSFSSAAAPVQPDYSSADPEPAYSPLSGPIAYYDPLAPSPQPPSLPEPSQNWSAGLDWPPTENPLPEARPSGGRRRKPDPLDSDFSLDRLQGAEPPAPPAAPREGGRRRRYDPDDENTGEVRPFRGDNGTRGDGSGTRDAASDAIRDITARGRDTVARTPLDNGPRPALDEPAHTQFNPAVRPSFDDRALFDDRPPFDDAARTQFHPAAPVWSPPPGPEPLPPNPRQNRPPFEPPQAAPAAPPMSRSARRHAESQVPNAPQGAAADRRGGVDHGAANGLPEWSARRRPGPDADPVRDRIDQAAVPTAAWSSLAESDQQLLSGESVAGDLLRDAQERDDRRAERNSRSAGKRRGGGSRGRVAVAPEPEPDDHLTDFYEPLDDDYDDYDDEPETSLGGRLSSFTQKAGSFARKSRDKRAAAAPRARARAAGRSDEEEHRRQWLVIAGQSVGAAVAGMLLFKGFERMWEMLPWVALALAMIVILGLVALVRVLRRTDDIVSTVIAVVVGVFVTLGPLAFLLSTN
ncbi:ABC transporter permease [Nocardia aurantiaca]|uniref:Uncharacterized protein n=1 Tax=Nocardia aurantiaca TaxID=2675850 RepID=A0A6I3L3Y8_9NOCA|nr:hypothetical protein [Nocardia aurantiaca]MTE16557.1 hypothetical protein [Nocardia aurantiaca]